MYRRLDSTKILETLTEMCAEIRGHFPDSSLNRLGDELLEVTREAQAKADWIARPIYILWVFKAVTIVLLTVLLVAPYWLVDSAGVDRIGIGEIIQAEEAAINVILVLGGSVLFLFSLERRIKRHRALEALHELRSMAHVIDMHQVPKDPEKVMSGGACAGGGHEQMDPASLIEYLDCCADLLAMIGKVAALYVQRFEDEVALAAVNEIEQLTTALARKLWQKISIAHQLMQAS